MDPMITDDEPANGNGTTSFELPDPPPPGTLAAPTSILQELSKFEPFDETTCSWPDFAERLQEHFELFNVPSEKRVRIFIDRISNATYEKLRGICKPIPPLEKPLDELWQIMDRYFNRYWNAFRERVKFIRRDQRAHESILKYALELKRWSKNCRFPEPWAEEALITQFMNGIRSDEIRKKLFRLEDSNFDQMVELASNIEAMQASLKASADEAAAVNAAAETTAATDVNPVNAASPANAGTGSGEVSTSNAMEVDASSDAVVCYNCFVPGHKSPACQLKKKKPARKKRVNKNPPDASNPVTNTTNNAPTRPNPPANQSKNKPMNKKPVTNQSKTQGMNKNTNQVKKQNPNQFKFQNKSQFKNQYRSQPKPFLNYSNEPGGYFDDFKNVLRNQYKDLHKKEYSNQSYNNDHSNRYPSSTYQPNKSLFY